MVGQCHKNLPVSNFEWIDDTSQFNEDFIKNYNEESHQVDVQYFEKLYELRNDLPFLLKGMKIEKSEKLVANLHEETEYVIHITSLNHGLVLEILYKTIKFNRNAWLKP